MQRKLFGIDKPQDRLAIGRTGGDARQPDNQECGHDLSQPDIDLPDLSLAVEPRKSHAQRHAKRADQPVGCQHQRHDRSEDPQRRQPEFMPDPKPREMNGNHDQRSRESHVQRYPREAAYLGRAPDLPGGIGTVGTAQTLAYREVVQQKNQQIRAKLPEHGHHDEGEEVQA